MFADHTNGAMLDLTNSVNNKDLSVWDKIKKMEVRQERSDETLIGLSENSSNFRYKITGDMTILKGQMEDIVKNASKSDAKMMKQAVAQKAQMCNLKHQQD